ncbi:MAG: tetratricopeptide repeat protein [Gammaproteobacteria bacterium]|nr:tetratricopeptide repeat protein [Gammaproteobacteria bacterium]
MSRSRPLTIEQAISKAKKASKRGNDSLALQIYRTVLQRQPDHPVAKKGLHKLQKKNSRAKNQRPQKQATNPSQEQLNALLNLYRSGYLEQAERSCLELLQTYPRSLIIINVLGTVFQVQGKLKEAIEAFDRSIELDPDSAEAYSNRGNAMKELGRSENTEKCYERAMASYDKAIELKPDFVEAFFNRGNALKESGTAG